MKQSFFEKHPKLTFIMVYFVLFLILAGMAEIVLRQSISYDIGYYSAVRGEGEYRYPFGTISINAEGYPDDEFDLTSEKPRIGYFGDSVTYGTGAGSGHRFSDLLQGQFPQYEHWTFAMVNNGIQDMRLLKTAREYDLDTVIYAMNLNDIMPVSAQDVDGGEKTTMTKLRDLVYRNLDGLRGKSYFYTWLRTQVKNALVRMGYGHMGFKAVEFAPRENIALIEEVAQRINKTAQTLADEKINFCLFILPYEMQISEDAARVYADLGISWEKGFTAGSTQTILRQYLDIPHIYNGIEAFQDIRAPKVGEFFVYNKGDKIDFNHPNRNGHAVLTEGLVRSESCPVFKN